MSLTVWKDNLLPMLTGTITTEADAEPVNLTGSSVKLMARPKGKSTVKIDASMTIVSPTAGTVRYPWVAADVDTVGVLVCWMRVTTGGKDQDTPEFEIIIAEHAPAAIEVPNPVGEGGRTTIFEGDSYLGSRALVYELQVMDAPDLSGVTSVKFRVTDLLEVDAVVVGEDSVTVELTSANTSALNVTTGVDFELEGTVSSGNVVTLLRSTLVVQADLAGP